MADFIQANRTRITAEWETFARTCHPAGATPSTLVLRDHIDWVLAVITDDMRQPQTREEQAEKGKGRGAEHGLDGAGDAHARQRVDVGFRLDQAAAEFRALRASIVRLWEESSPEPARTDRGDLIRFNETIDQILIDSVNEYSRQLHGIRDQFLGILGHDLRNPLGAIMMAAGSISRASDVDERHSKAAQMILNSVMRMDRMVGDLLDLTRTRLGADLPLTRGPMDLAAACRQVLTELGTLHPDRTLRFEPSGDLHGCWDGDRLMQVVSNLVANALQHGDEAAPVIVSAWADEGQVALAVHNQGPPIPPEDTERIFEPLAQAERPGRAKQRTSLGLGLYIVRAIVLAHGGELALTSSAEQGTTFTVRLPREPPPPSRC